MAEEVRQNEVVTYPDLKTFFGNALTNSKPICENCGLVLAFPSHKNVAHIVPKARFRSVKTVSTNKMILCTNFDRNDTAVGCHETYDKGWKSASKMKVWELAKSRYRTFRDMITEKSLTLIEYFES